MQRAPLNDAEERKRYCRLAYLVPAACIAGICLARLLGSIFEGRLPAPAYSEGDVVLWVVPLTTLTSGIFLALARPPWWHGIFWSGTIVALWAQLITFAT